MRTSKLLGLFVGIFLLAASCSPSSSKNTSTEQPSQLKVQTPSTTTPSSAGDPSTWATFTDPDDFYSIRYPNLGKFFVRYSPLPLKTILGWTNGDFDIQIETIDPNGLSLYDWLKQDEGIDVTADHKNDIQMITINNMNGVLAFSPTSGEVIAYLEQDFYEEPLIHVIDFTSYTHDSLYPPFWSPMLQTFEGLPEAPQ